MVPCTGEASQDPVQSYPISENFRFGMTPPPSPGGWTDRTENVTFPLAVVMDDEMVE